MERERKREGGGTLSTDCLTSAGGGKRRRTFERVECGYEGVV